ncbi:carbohydrate kinase family protein [Candidatus Daviesbacteria bacterium]|nr:carbohydrate kinase family protein [Candidatus Daviesbacteria bacterium]MBI4035328.1 carbohydrate kinase family protein [Candidatus Daviesbacteria bacterium]
MILVTGSLAFDHIMDFPGKFADHILPDKIHQINLSFLVNNLSKQKGGNAGNIAYTLALFGCPVAIVGSVGGDFSEYANFLQDAGVDVSKIKIIEGDSTSSAFIMTDLADNQITAFYPGAMNEASSLSLSGVQSDLVVISPNDPNAMVNFVKQCQISHTPYMFDPGMQLPVLSDEQLLQEISAAEILVGNDYEMELIKQRIKDQTLLKKIKILITTLGEKGSLIQTKEQTIQVNPAKPDQVLDPTGAGDAYRAGFLAGYIKNLDLKTCGQMGSVAACYAIEKYGTTNHKFSILEFCQRYKENFGEELNYEI